jgi:hypothetical protein
VFHHPRLAWIVAGALAGVATLLFGSSSLFHRPPAPAAAPMAGFTLSPPAAAQPVAAAAPAPPVLPVAPMAAATAPAVPPTAGAVAPSSVQLPPSSPPSPPSLPSPPRSPPPAPAPAETAASGATVRLSVTGTEGAEVFVDGVVVGNVPLQITLIPIAEVRHILVQRSGYTRWRYDIAGDRDAALVAPLERRKKAASQSLNLKDPFQ